MNSTPARFLAASPVRRRAALVGAAFALLGAIGVGGCGGGVDSGGTGAPAVAYAAGPISGFGSVIVNGVHFDESAAAIVDADGNARTRDDLKLGMTTEINGSAVLVDAAGISSSKASRVAYASAVLGPIAAIDTAAHTLSVLGQTVAVAPSTVFDDTLAGGLAALAVGDVVEIYALADFASGRYVATRIERRSAPAAYVLRAVVGNLNTTAHTFTLGSLVVSYGALASNQLPAGFANGQIVRVQLATAPLAGVWQATQLRAGAPMLEDRDEARLEGLITTFVSSAQFSVDGVAVDASRAVFPDGTAALAAGVRVRVDGVAAGSVVQASRVELRTDGQLQTEGFEVDGTITALDTVARTFVVRGVVVDYSGSVDFRDGTAGDLRVGALVEVRGALAAGGTTLQASRVRFKG